VNACLFDRLYLPERDTRIAVLFEQRKITYAEMRRATVQAAEALHALDIAEGDRVAILLNDSPEFIASFVAIISLGAIAVPINMALRADDHLFILRDCGARAAIVEAAAAETIFQSGDAASNGLSELKELLVVSRKTESIDSSYAGIKTTSFANAPRRQLGDEFPKRGGENDPAFILYTSGSTGEAKGAVHRESDIFYTNETFCREVLQPRASDRFFSSSRLPFAYGLGNIFTFPLLNGLPTILCREKPAPEVINRILNDYGPTIFFGVPLVYRLLLDHHRGANRLDTSSLRLCVSAGEALPAQLGEEWQKTFGLEVLDGIGSTEMLHMFMSNHAGEVRYGSSGKLLNGYQARLIDHDGNPTRPDSAGNLWARGDSAAIGYWQRTETTAQTFMDGWVRTGDLYRCDRDGYWWHMGRSDDCFKPTGQWVSPVEVEGVLLRNKAVRTAAVVEGLNEHGLSCVCAVVVPQNEMAAPDLIEDELRSICESTLPKFKRPQRYVFLSELPYTATGKVQRFKLRERLRMEAETRP
jgi:benzoate-CoA ligase family protein